MSGNDSEALIHYTESRMMEGDFATLLCRYGKDGHMHSISRTEERTQHYDLPCQGKYHRHQFIEIFYVMEGSFEQILLGEKRCFFKGEVVITDQNCEHADYLEEVSMGKIEVDLGKVKGRNRGKYGLKII